MELSPDERARLEVRFGRSFEAGEALFAIGDAATAVHFVLEGRVRVVLPDPAGELVVRVADPGDFVGEESLLDKRPYAASAIASERSATLALPPSAVRSVLGKQPATSLRMVERLLDRVTTLEERLADARLADPMRQCVRALLRAGRHTGATGKATLSLTPTTLAAETGLRLDEVRRLVAELERAGKLSVADRTLDCDLDALHALDAALAVSR